jgi:hypothetical protein
VSVSAVVFPFVDTDPNAHGAGLRPFLPITLTRNGKSVSSHALLDTGSSVNVMPYDLGLQLGAIWDEQTVSLPLTGALANLEARGLVAWGKVGSFPPVELAFAWTKSNSAPFLLGQMNFFLEFEVCFFRARATVEIRPKR